MTKVVEKVPFPCRSKFKYSSCGIITGCEEGWKYLGSNVLLTVLTILYVTVIMAPICLILKKFKVSYSAAKCIAN